MGFMRPPPAAGSHSGPHRVAMGTDGVRPWAPASRVFAAAHTCPGSVPSSRGPAHPAGGCSQPRDRHGRALSLAVAGLTPVACRVRRDKHQQELRPARTAKLSCPQRHRAKRQCRKPDRGRVAQRLHGFRRGAREQRLASPAHQIERHHHDGDAVPVAKKSSGQPLSSKKKRPGKRCTAVRAVAIREPLPGRPLLHYQWLCQPAGRRRPYCSRILVKTAER